MQHWIRSEMIASPLYLLNQLRRLIFAGVMLLSLAVMLEPTICYKEIDRFSHVCDTASHSDNNQVINSMYRLANYRHTPFSLNFLTTKNKISISEDKGTMAQVAAFLLQCFQFQKKNSLLNCVVLWVVVIATATATCKKTTTMKRSTCSGASTK